MAHKTQPGPLGREQFRERALARFEGLCCLGLSARATEARHIFDRKLFEDGGYFERNAAPVRGPCHLLAETTEIGVEAVARAAGASPPILPPCAAGHGVLDPADCGRMDKSGNLILAGGALAPGPLAGDDGCRKALALGGKLWSLRGPAGCS